MRERIELNSEFQSLGSAIEKNQELNTDQVAKNGDEPSCLLIKTISQIVRQLVKARS